MVRIWGVWSSLLRLLVLVEDWRWCVRKQRIESVILEHLTVVNWRKVIKLVKGHEKEIWWVSERNNVGGRVRGRKRDEHPAGRRAEIKEKILARPH
jgi:hypothetical protein